MNICELTMSITALANSLACNLTTDEVDFLGAVFSQLGDTLNTIATQRSICENMNSSNNTSNTSSNSKSNDSSNTTSNTKSTTT